jgi:hypothetical protein
MHSFPDYMWGTRKSTLKTGSELLVADDTYEMTVHFLTSA